MDGPNSPQLPWNALSIPFQAQIDAFVLEFPEHSALKTLPANQKLMTLSNLLKTQQYAIHVARCFSPLLVDLCARWLDDHEQDESKFAVFGLLLPAHEELYPVLSQFLSRPSLANGPLGFVTRENTAQIPLKTLHILLLAYHRLIEASCHLHQEFKWPNSHLQCLFEPPQHPDAGVRLLAIRCFAFHVGMNEPARAELEENLVGTPENVDPFVETGFGDTVDVWVLPILDSKRVAEQKKFLKETFKLCYGPSELDASVLSERVAYVGGTLQLKRTLNSAPTNYVQTSTNFAALQQASVLLTRRMPILLSGPSSSGKTTLIEYLATTLSTTTSNVVTVHLADTSLDPRSLLGSYVSSVEDPGTFEWKDGVLVQAMQEGKFLVLENIDKASGEVLGTLWPLVESLSMRKPIGGHAQLNVLGRKNVVAKEGFALFATRTIRPTENGTLSPPTFLGSHKWKRVDLRSGSDEEMVLILQNKFGGLSTPLIKSTLVIWNALNDLDKQYSSSTVRPIHTGDLMKWAARIQTSLQNRPGAAAHAMDEDGPIAQPLASLVLNPVIREELFLEARDIFFGSVNPDSEAPKARVEAGLHLLAESLSISTDRVKWLLEKRTAELELRKGRDGGITQVSLDRIVLNVARSSLTSTNDASITSRFALHRPSLNLLASLVGCIQANEAVLLTGETGTGKTTVVTYLASLLSQPLISLNLSHQTESSDLLGGYKPLDPRMPAQALQEKFTWLFSKTFSREKNIKFEGAIRIAVSGGKWKRAVALWKEAAGRAEERIREKANLEVENSLGTAGEDAPRKRRKLGDAGPQISREQWTAFQHDVSEFEVNHVLGNSKAAFHFVEGPLVTALRMGDWVLLDEINLASSETLEAIGSILHDSTGSITLTERGDLEPVSRHPNFRLFTCMNPATDVGKKDLPPHIRSQLTEIYVSPPDANREALLAIISQYIGQIAMADPPAILDVAEFYVAARKMAEAGNIADGANQKPHYSMRTLTRALTFAVGATAAFGLRRALWEGCLMAFSTILEPNSAAMLKSLAAKHLLSDAKNLNSLLAQIPAPPEAQGCYISVGPFWLERGPIGPRPVTHYVVTRSVQAKVLDLARILTTRQFPVLIQGPTSSGKTSVIEYLARLTGHRFVRINNHEHTDIQEYVGSYVTNPKTGLLVFQDGLLVQALRRGDWIVLDELNLAPSDVLEALNRLLDDNRELVIPETGEVVKPHPHFMIFATQNPPGVYGGRKVLSRAFRNRFLELHFQDVPQHELEQIIKERCEIAPSYAERIVSVFRELQTRRQAGRVFETKHGFATLRDLFRWAGRGAGSYQELAEDGYMLIAERTRKGDDKVVVKEVIESIMKVKIDEAAMYDILSPRVIASLNCRIPTDSDVVWTSAMQRLFVLLARAFRHKEPTLLVGETGSGKTSVCELYANTVGAQLRTINCHQNTETADLLGGQRPLRHRAAWTAERTLRAKTLLPASATVSDADTEDSLLASINAALETAPDPAEKSLLREAARLLSQPVPLFEWQDGPLVLAMRSAGIFLLDEISLADDSVLERLNSVLESSRTLVLAEKGTWNPENLEIVAHSEFQIVGTMNPGGDHGKKELSPALRNRFTEIWVPMISGREDRLLIVRASWINAAFLPFTEAVVDFLHWMTEALDDDSVYGLRDLLAWVHFSDQMALRSSLALEDIFHHSAYMVVLDGLSSLPRTQGWSSDMLSDLRQRAISKLTSLCPIQPSADSDNIVLGTTAVSIGPFKIQRGSNLPAAATFAFQAPTTLENARRVLRACQLNKAILLEGSPGVGKTSLVSALASFSCQTLCRVNLSDQTDLIDLFGSDLPLEGGTAGEFAWRDAAFLQALQRGHWVLLDEMNLAPQSVLEGLNAILDHRGTVFLPELGRSFTKHPHFRLFAAQNPAQQGGGRKGLPKSFLNRFTKVYMEELNSHDLLIISKSLHPDRPEAELRQMIDFNSSVQHEAVVRRSLGHQGSPWEFNLRDIMRWLALCKPASPLELNPGNPAEYMDEIYIQRFRTASDRLELQRIENRVFPRLRESVGNTHVSFSTRYVQFGHSLVERKPCWQQPMDLPSFSYVHLKGFEVMARCVDKGWLIILVGHASAGKTTILQQFAAINGEKIKTLSATSSTDASDLLGGFEQEQGPSIDEYDTPGEHHNGMVVDGAHRQSNYTDGTGLTDIASISVTKGASGRLTDSLKSKRLKGRFAWADGPLVQALKDGTWFILDNANLCNPSVLDRLNSLCEPGGVLTLTERGLLNGEPQALRPHPNFRLFMTMDPSNGELSRAMRNRGVEISVGTIQTGDESGTLVPEVDSDLDHRWNHLHLRPMQHLMHLLLKFEHFALDIRLDFVLQYLSRSDYFLLPRLKTLSWLGSSASAMLDPRGNIIDLLGHLAERLSLPVPFLVAERAEPLLNAHLYARMSQSGVLDIAEWNSVRRMAMLRLWKVVNDSEQAHGFLGDSVSEISRNISQGRSFGNEVSSEIKAIYPVLSTCRTFLERLVTTVSPVHDVTACHALAELWSNACEITQQVALDYTLWRTTLQELDQLHPRLKDIELKNAVSAALQSLRLTSGFAMDSIWAQQKPYYQGQQRIREVLHELQPEHPSTKLSVDRRKHTLELAALLLLEEPRHPVQPDSIERSLKNSIATDDQEVVAQLTLLYLPMLQLAMTRGDASCPMVEQYCHVALETAGFPRRPLVSMKAAQWAINTSRLDAGHIGNAFYDWAASLWDISPESGAKILTLPGALHAMLNLCARPSRTIATSESYRKSLYNSLHSTALECKLPPLSRIELLTQIFMNDLAIVASLDSPKKKGETPAKSFPSFNHKGLTGGSSNIRALEELLRSCHSRVLTPTSDLDQMIALSTGWVYLGLLMIHSYIPNHPLDPEGANAFQHARLSATQHCLTAQIEMHRYAETLSTGEATNLMVQDLESRLNHARALLQDLPPCSDVARSVIDLQSLFSELLRFHDQLLDVGRTQELLQALIDDNDTASSREQVNQDSWARFIERIQARYPALGDLWYPVDVWMSRIRVGMSLLRHASACRLETSQTASTSFLRALTTFPTTIGCELLSSSKLAPPSHLDPLEWSTTRILASISQLKGGDPLERHRISLWGAFEQLFGLWLETKLRQDLEEKEKNSLYKRKKDVVTMQADEEIEAEEFRRLFPEYGDVLDEESPQISARESSQMRFSPYQLFLDWSTATCSGSSATLAAPGDAVNLPKWTRQVEDELDPAVDRSSIVFRIRNLYKEIGRLGQVPLPSAGYDFYCDNNVPEVRRAVEIVQALDERLTTLAAAWPEQMVLRHLSERCQAIADLSVYSSLAQVLSALEQLLLQTDDWQKYANKDNGILEYQQSLGNLIIDWRRIELSCWAHLLDAQAAAFSKAIAEWWFRMYESIVETSKSVQGDDEAGFLKDVLPLLEDFLISSPIGQFASRLQLLDMFKSFIMSTYPGDSFRPLLQRVARLLGALTEFYGRFTIRVQSALSSRREVIDKEVKSFIKLASWKDVNVLALKASAQRTHQQLHRSIRRFRAVLQEPVTPLLAQLPEHLPQISGSSSENMPLMPIRSAVPPLRSNGTPVPHLANLQDTLQIFHNLSCENTTPFLTQNAGLTEELSGTIMSHIDELQKAVPPPGISNEKSWAKNLLNRKRRAFADLLKACKETGLPSQVSSKQRSLQEDRLWLMEHRTVIYHSSETTKVMDFYFDKILSSLPALHLSLGSHSDDVSTRDLAKLLDYTHGILHYALEARTGLLALSDFCHEIQSFSDTIARAASDNEIVLFGLSAQTFVIEHLSLLSHAISAASEIVEAALEFSQYGEEVEAFDGQQVSRLQEKLILMKEMQQILVALYGRLSKSQLPVLLSDERRSVTKSISLVKELRTIMLEWESHDPRVHHLCDTLLHSLCQRLARLDQVPSATPTSEKEVPERPIGIMLVMIQRLRALDSTPLSHAFLREGEFRRRRLWTILDITHLWKELQSFASDIQGSSQASIMARRLCPFLQRFQLLANSFLLSLTAWAKSLFKLASVLVTLGQNLAKNGFCKPEEIGDQSTVKDADMKADGTGIGEGAGDKDISKDIEDESQVEGLQGEENQAEREKGKKQEDKESGVEMKGDFDGELESMQGSEEKDSDRESEGEAEEIDEKIEELDPADPEAVDEKMWENQGAKDEKKESMQSQEQSNGVTNDSQMAAKEDDSRQRHQEERDGEGQRENESSSGEDSIEETNHEADGPDTENLPNEAGAQMDDHVQEDDVLNLPEGLELEIEAESKLSEGGDDDKDSDMDAEDDARNDETTKEDATLEDEQDGSVDGRMEANPGSDTVGEEEEGAEPEITAKPDESSGEGQQDSLGMPNAPIDANDDGREGNERMDIEHQEARSAAPPGSAQAQEFLPGQSKNTPPNQETSETTGETQDQAIRDDALRPGSRKSLADALAEVQRRYEQIQQQSNDNDPWQNRPKLEDSQMEHAEDAEDIQLALGPVREDEVTKLRDLNIVDDNKSDHLPQEDMEMLDIAELEQFQTVSLEAKLRESSSQPPTSSKEAEAILTGETLHREHGIDQQNPLDALPGIPAPGITNCTSEEVEDRLISWHNRNESHETADSIWRLYSSLTHELAWTLCEQLRLILEPTKATRLRGDYRTGKRLNMKKIIPYIASEYTKDKIWLRRTHPSQREYQILLALDDSRSMSESHAEHLAFQTLALVSKALTRLEAGDISVVRFGETVDVLHEFSDGPFNDVAGARAIASFGFNQTSTDVLSLVETSLAVLQKAREMRSNPSTLNANLWQLEIIISDGICSNHDKLRAALRRASEQRVMIVFIVVDALTRSNIPGQSGDRQMQNSILFMKQVRADLSVERYLDTFPFEYYVVLRNVDALPEVLSSTLKQFFERIAEE